MKTLDGQRLVNLLRQRCDGLNSRLWIAVPYIGHIKAVLSILGRAWIDNSSISLRILTDVSEVNHFNSDTLKLFARYGEIRTLPGIHAKIYITDKTCLVTSANLTSTAFTRRHEIGIFFDSSEGKKTVSTFNSWWKKASAVAPASLEKIVNKIRQSSEETTGEGLAKLWHLPPPPEEITYWLKPIGVTEAPITEERTFEKLKDYLHFSTPSRRPKVYRGDIIIEYGIGAKRILSVYKATSDVQRVTRAHIRKNDRVKRWPWYVIGKNLTPSFGMSWYKHNLFMSDLVRDYLASNPNGYVTLAGSKNLNALMRGKDKIKLDPHFAQFVI